MKQVRSSITGLPLTKRDDNLEYNSLLGTWTPKRLDDSGIMEKIDEPIWPSLHPRGDEEDE